MDIYEPAYQKAIKERNKNYIYQAIDKICKKYGNVENQVLLQSGCLGYNLEDTGVGTALKKWYGLTKKQVSKYAHDNKLFYGSPSCRVDRMFVVASILRYYTIEKSKSMKLIK